MYYTAATKVDILSHNKNIYSMFSNQTLRNDCQEWGSLWTKTTNQVWFFFQKRFFRRENFECGALQRSNCYLESSWFIKRSQIYHVNPFKFNPSKLKNPKVPVFTIVTINTGQTLFRFSNHIIVLLCQFHHSTFLSTWSFPHCLCKRNQKNITSLFLYSDPKLHFKKIQLTFSANFPIQIQTHFPKCRVWSGFSSSCSFFHSVICIRKP